MRSGRGEVHASDRLAVVRVAGDLPPQGVDALRRDPLLGRETGFEPGVSRVLRVDGVDPRERRKQQRHSYCDSKDDRDEPGQRLPPTSDREPQRERYRWATLTGDVTRPSRTMTSGSAYAATRGSWVTRTTVVSCSRTVVVSSSITCLPARASRGRSRRRSPAAQCRASLEPRVASMNSCQMTGIRTRNDAVAVGVLLAAVGAFSTHIPSSSMLSSRMRRPGMSCSSAWRPHRVTGTRPSYV
jgi:hypothetical protein